MNRKQWQLKKWIGFIGTHNSSEAICWYKWRSCSRRQPQRVTWRWHWTATCACRCCLCWWSTATSSAIRNTCPPCWRPCFRPSTACLSARRLPRDSWRWSLTSWWPSHSELLLMAVLIVKLCCTCPNTRCRPRNSWRWSVDRLCWTCL